MDTKSLRQKILDLAIRGKLVPQDPNDEPASVLLERIRTEKQQMVKDGKLKAKDIKGDSVIFKGEDNLHYEKIGSEVKCIEAEIPFEIPDSWCWCRLESIIELTNGISKRRGTGGIDTIVLRLADLVEDTISFTQTRRINLIKKKSTNTLYKKTTCFSSVLMEADLMLEKYLYLIVIHVSRTVTT
jgi:hypothetical protein